MFGVHGLLRAQTGASGAIPARAALRWLSANATCALPGDDFPGAWDRQTVAPACGTLYFSAPTLARICGACITLENNLRRLDTPLTTLTAPGRNAGIDCLRGLAIILVIVHHLALPFRLPLGPSLLHGWVPKRLIDAISFNGYEAVFIFFVISGFLIATRILAVDGDLRAVQLRRFYIARAWRILPLLLAVLAVLTLLALFDVPGFGPDPAIQSVGGLLGSALSLSFNWYEGRTGWAPAGWDVLWSLSIEELFYLGFPILCLLLPRRALIGLLLVWALCLVPLRDLVPASNEVWREKAYLPGMAAISWGVLAAMLQARWRPDAALARALLVGGGLAILLALGWGELLQRLFRGAGMLALCLGSSCMLLGCADRTPRVRPAWQWLARMGTLSYELYLSHMFVVLAAEAAYRAVFGTVQTWTFAVYLPVLVLCYWLAVGLHRAVAAARVRWNARGAVQSGVK